MKYFLILIFALPSTVVFSQDTLTKADLSTAQKVMGLKFTDAERDSLYDRVKGTIREYDKMRKIHLPNSVTLTLAFNPVLPGMVLDHTQKKIKWEVPSGITMPSNMNDLSFYSISQLASLIKNKKISSVELTKFFLNRKKIF